MNRTLHAPPALCLTNAATLRVLLGAGRLILFVETVEMFRQQRFAKKMSQRQAISPSTMASAQRAVCARLATVIVAVAVGGCASHGHRTEERPQEYPENYKAELLAYLHTYINDPTNIRDATIADPMLKPVNASTDGSADPGVGRRSAKRGRGGNGGEERADEGSGPLGLGGANPFDSGGSKRERYVVCVRYNAKDRDGRYTGAKQGMAIYFRGRFDGFSGEPHGACDQAQYKPFPELENLGR
jgi:hypothetical protein